MKEPKEGCSICKKDLPIVNRTKWLCDDCNFCRLHDGQSREQVARQKQSKSLKFASDFNETNNESNNKNKSFKIKNITVKQASLNQKLSHLKKEIALEAIQNDEYYCKGCGSSSEIDKSHILSIGQRKDLELVKENIQLLCRRCHLRWESGSYEKMSSLWCFENNLEYIKTVDLNKYHKILNSRK